MCNRVYQRERCPIDGEKEREKKEQTSREIHQYFLVKVPWKEIIAKAIIRGNWVNSFNERQMA